MKTALINFFLIQKILKTDGVMSIFRGVRCDILSLKNIKFTIFLISLLIRKNITKASPKIKHSPFFMFFLHPKQKFSKAISILSDVIPLN